MGATVVDNISLLKRSTQARAGTPDGNIFFDTSSGVLEIIVASELAFLDFPTNTVPNTLTLDNKPTIRAIYELQQTERTTDAAFRQHDPFVKGRFKLGKAFDFVFGRNAGNDRDRISATGWREFDATNANINRIYFNVSTLDSVLDTSQVYGQNAADGSTFDFARLGAVNESFQVFGTTAHSDAGAGDFNFTSYLAVSVSTYGQRHQRVVLSDFGITELEGYGTLAALGESPHPSTIEADYPLADVYGGSQQAPWTGVSFDVLGAPESKTGFNEADGDFSLVIRNTGGATLDEIIAWCDASNDVDADIAATGTWNGKQKNSLYTFDANGIPNFITGLYIESLPAADQQRLKIFDDAGSAKTFPFSPQVSVSIPLAAQGSSTGVYECFILDGDAAQDYNTDNAVTLNDSDTNPVTGAIGASSTISFGIPYDGFNQAGLTGPVDFSVRFLITSDGEFEEAFVDIPVTRTTLITASISTNTENNI